MIKIEIVVCDDQPEGLYLITSTAVKEFENNKAIVEIKQYTNPIELLDDIDKGLNFDVIFLDIEMPELDGFTLAKKLKQKHDVIIVFVTNISDYVFDAFKIHPFAFVRKRAISQDLPYTIKDIVDTIIKTRKMKDKIITIEVNNKFFTINPYNIMYAEVQNKIVTLTGTENNYEIPYRLTKLVALLEEYDFIKIHRHTAVNCLYIRSIQRTAVIMDNNVRLDMSKNKEKEVREKFCAFAGK